MSVAASERAGCRVSPGRVSEESVAWDDKTKTDAKSGAAALACDWLRGARRTRLHVDIRLPLHF